MIDIEKLKQAALEALDNMDDYARMEIGIAPIGAVNHLTNFINTACTRLEAAESQQVAQELVIQQLRDALDWIQTHCAGDAMPKWENTPRTRHSRGLILDRTNYALATVTAQRDLLKGSVAEVEGKYFAFLKEKDVDAKKSKDEGDMYGWNFHMGEKAGAAWMHLFMTELLKAASLKGE